MVNKQGQTNPSSKADNRKEKEKDTHKHKKIILGQILKKSKAKMKMKVTPLTDR